MTRTLLITPIAALFACGNVAANTIEFTGDESDFDFSHLLENDGVDTELFDCGFGPVDAALDIGRVYCANDEANLYIGFQYNRYCFCDMQLGIGIDVGPGGGTTDPFNRQIIWNGPTQPDFVLYDLIPTSCNGFNFEIIYRWDGAAWTSLGDGSNFWNFHDTDGGGFKEFAIPLATLGVEAPATVCLEMWTTQDDFGNGDRPAFDLVVNDGSQASTPGGTMFSVPDGNESMLASFVCKELEIKPVPAEARTWSGVKATFR